MKFQAFNLKKEVINALYSSGYKDCTKVQEKVIPLALKNNNLLVRSETGSGKTHSFLVPLMNKINISNRNAQALIIAPTRELAKQIFDFATMFSKYIKGLSIKLFSGGNERTKEMNKAKEGAQIIIGTPGRLLDLFLKSGGSDITGVKTIIIDEADMCMDLGYYDEMIAILKRAQNAQKMIFSATYPDKLKIELTKLLRINEVIEIGSNKANMNVSHIAIDRKHRPLEEATLDFIKATNPYFLLIFASKKETVKSLHEFLISRGINAASIHGDLEQRERKSIMKFIKEGRYNIVVCSDMASRGIDIPNISTVLNYDLPNDYSFYFHRAGRSGRIGNKGECYTFYNVDDYENIKKLQNMGVSFSFLSLNNGELKEGKLNVRKPKPISKEKQALNDEIKIACQKVRTKKVKPNYKKKVREAAEKVKKKHKREIIRKDIRRQMTERYKKEGKRYE